MAKINWTLANKRKNTGKPEKASWGENWLRKNDPLVSKPLGAAAGPQSKQAKGR